MQAGRGHSAIDPRRERMVGHPAGRGLSSMRWRSKASSGRANSGEFGLPLGPGGAVHDGWRGIGLGAAPRFSSIRVTSHQADCNASLRVAGPELARFPAETTTNVSQHILIV